MATLQEMQNELDRLTRLKANAGRQIVDLDIDDKISTLQKDMAAEQAKQQQPTTEATVDQTAIDKAARQQAMREAAQQQAQDWGNAYNNAGNAGVMRVNNLLTNRAIANNAANTTAGNLASMPAISTMLLGKHPLIMQNRSIGGQGNITGTPMIHTLY